MTGNNVVVISSQPILGANYTAPLLLMYLYLYCVKWRNQLQEGAADSKGEKTSQVLLFRILSSTRTLAVYLNLVRRCHYWGRVLSYKLFFL
jgi:hypothetical protein